MKEKNIVIMIDPLGGLMPDHIENSIKQKTEIFIPQRVQYTGSPVAIRDPIALEYIAGYLEKFGYKPIVILKGLKEDSEIVSVASSLRDELLAICFGLHSTYLVPQTLKLSEELKNEMPEIPIIVGGYHPTGDPTIISNYQIDYAVIGEGEKSAKELLDAIKSGKDFHSIEGIAFKDGTGRIVVTPRRKRLEFSELQWPKRYNSILSLCQPGPLSYPPIGRVAQIAYSRGCPYSCNFCASPKVWGNKIKYRAPKDVTKEMEYLITHFNINNFFFCDLSFNFSKGIVIELCEHIKRLKNNLADIKFGSHVMCNISNIDNDIIGVMKEANVAKIDYGIESLSSDTLQCIKPSQDTRKIQENLKLTNRNGILIRALMMVGYPWESKNTMLETKEKILDLPVDQLRLCFYVPFPGAEIYEQLKDRIIVGYEGFTTDVPAIKCDGIDSEELKREVLVIQKEFYNSENYAEHVRSKIKSNPEFYDSFLEFFTYLYNKNIITLSSPCMQMITDL